MDVTESLQSFHKANLITFGLRKRWKISPMITTVLIYLFFNTVLLIAAIRDNIVFTTGTRLGFLSDFGWWVTITLGFNVILYTLLWLPGGIAEIILTLVQNKTIRSPSSQSDEERTLDAYIRRFVKSFSNPFWHILAAVIASTYTLIFMLPDQRKLIIWQTANEFSFWFVIFFWALYVFSVSLVVFRAAVTIVWFNRLFRNFDVDVKVLHPDNAGGLGPLGRFSMALVVVIAVVVTSSVVGDLSEALITGKAFIDIITRPYSLAIYVVYTIGSPLLFFAPLSVAHNAMRKAKEEFIAKISNQFDVELARIETQLTGDETQLKKGLSKLEELQKLHALASRFPVWPYNTGSLARFFGAIVSPILISLLSFVIEKVFK